MGKRMIMSLEADSRNYVVALPLHRAEDIPRDFDYREDPGFLIGVFLPRDDPDWFDRSDYPARILLLFEDRVAVIPHPKSRKATPVNLPLEDLEAVESGQSLLKGWIRFHGRETTEIPYNRRTSEPVEQWLRALRRGLCRNQAMPSPNWRMLGGPLDIKFRNALVAESEDGEEPLALWFRAADERAAGYGIFSRKISDPGHLMAVMANRVLWVTDRIGRGRDRYGYVATYAPRRAVKELTARPEWFGVTLKSARQWTT